MNLKSKFCLYFVMKGVSRNVQLSRQFDLAVEKNILVVGVHEGLRCGCLGEKGRRWRRCLFAWAQWCSLVLLWVALATKATSVLKFNYSNNVDLAT
jgi:hypothetical protein